MNKTERIVIITDVHANLPALEAALAAIRADGATAIYHIGDAIGIGPFPAESSTACSTHRPCTSSWATTTRCLPSVCRTHSRPG